MVIKFSRHWFGARLHLIPSGNTFSDREKQVCLVFRVDTSFALPIKPIRLAQI
jgi:hypothetical protein